MRDPNSEEPLPIHSSAVLQPRVSHELGIAEIQESYREMYLFRNRIRTIQHKHRQSCVIADGVKEDLRPLW